MYVCSAFCLLEESQLVFLSCVDVFGGVVSRFRSRCLFVRGFPDHGRSLGSGVFCQLDSLRRRGQVLKKDAWCARCLLQSV